MPIKLHHASLRRSVWKSCIKLGPMEKKRKDLKFKKIRVKTLYQTWSNVKEKERLEINRFIYLPWCPLHSPVTFITLDQKFTAWQLRPLIGSDHPEWDGGWNRLIYQGFWYGCWKGLPWLGLNISKEWDTDQIKCQLNVPCQYKKITV